MIRSFKHKGLELLFTTGNSKGIRQDHLKRLRSILAKLDSATQIEDMRYPGSKLHALQGNFQDQYSVTVNGNWRVTFKFESGDAEVVDYLDYH